MGREICLRRARHTHMVLVDSVPFLDAQFFGARSRLRREQLLEVADGILRIAFHPDLLAQSVVADYLNLSAVDAKERDVIDGSISRTSISRLRGNVAPTMSRSAARAERGGAARACGRLCGSQRVSLCGQPSVGIFCGRKGSPACCRRAPPTVGGALPLTGILLYTGLLCGGVNFLRTLHVSS